jgi:hypothetical protein
VNGGGESVNATEPTQLRETVRKASGEIRTLLLRADAGDEKVVPELRAILNDPRFVELLGNLSRRIERELVERLAGKDLNLREGLIRKLSDMRDELAGPASTPIERQLIERVVLDWLTLHESECRFACARDLSTKQVEAWQRRIDRAHRRYRGAVKTLAVVRKMAIPVLIGQVHIARNQVNRN